MGWDAVALEGGFNAWRDRYGAEQLDSGDDTELMLAQDRL